MPRLIIALLRHAEYHQLPNTPSAHQPFPLTDNGREQAKLAASKITQETQRQGWRIAQEIQSSQLLRAWETATILAQELDGNYCVGSFDDLAERSMGSAANLPVEHVEEIIRRDPRFDDLPADWKSNSHFRLPLQGGESLLEAGERVANHLEYAVQYLADKVEQDTVQLVVGHGAAMRHAAFSLGILQFHEIAKLSMYHAEPVYIEYKKSGWSHVSGDWKVREQIEGID